MTAWRMFLNDELPDCGVAACCNAILLWGGDVTDADAQLANDRFSSADYNSKVLWGWLRRGIGGNYLGGFARIRPSQIEDAIARFSCVFVAFKRFESAADHAVLRTKDSFISWGREYSLYVAPDSDISEAYAIAPKYHPILLWWTVSNFWMRFK